MKPENLLACVQYSENFSECPECRGARQELDDLINRYHALYWDALYATNMLKMSFFQRLIFLFMGSVPNLNKQIKKEKNCEN